MTVETSAPPASKKLIWAGRIISAFPVLSMGGMSTAFLLTNRPMITEEFVKQGYPKETAVPLLIVEILCTVLYAIPQTAVIGAVLLTTYLGGAVATRVRISEPIWLPVIFGVIVWVGLLLREPRLRSLLPLRRSSQD